MTAHRRFIIRLRQLRAERGMSQEALAKQAKFSCVFIARLETGVQDPTLTTSRKPAKALKVEVGELLT